MKNNFQPSVNIKLDQFDPNFIESYIATPSHTNIIKKIIEDKIDTENNSGSYLLVGPYGSGKSHLINILNNIIHDNGVSEILKELNNIDESISKTIKDFLATKLRKETIILTGYEGRFDLVIKQKIMQALHKYDIEVPDISLAYDILSTVEYWKLNYEDTYRAFTKKLSSKGYNMEGWKSKVESQDSKSIDDFKLIFENLTSGIEYQNDNRDSFFRDLKKLVTILEENNINLTIFYDEFGRVLEESSSSEINVLMQNIQDLAEVSTRTNSLDLIFVSHKNINQYIEKKYFPNLKNEFSKIEQRFDVNYIESDKLIFNRITKKTFDEVNLNLNPDIGYLQKMKKFVEKYPLFTELTSVKSPQLMIEESYPVHPITMFLLPRISNVFGQNERTLFTFLNHVLDLFREGLPEEEVIDPSYIYDYFFMDEMNSLQEEEFNSLAIRTNLILESLEKQENKLNLKKIIKLIFLWKASNSDNLFSLTNDIICDSLNLDIETVNYLTEKLRNNNFIRYSYIDNSYEIVERSNIVFEEIVKETIYKNNFTVEDLVARLNSVDFDYKYIFPSKYNEEYSITRYFKTVFSVDEKTNNPDNKADGYVDIIFQKSILNREDMIEKDGIQIILDYDEILFQLSERILAIEKSLSNRELLLEFSGLKLELEVAFVDTLQGIKNRIEHLLSQGNYGFVFGEKREGIELQYLGEDIDKKMYKNYSSTPVIVNDSINKKKITSVQRKALTKVLDHILKYPYEKNFNIEGNGPDYLIFCSLFKNHNYNLNDLSRISSAYSDIRNALVTHLKKNPEGELSDLYDIVVSPPFGVREPLVPLLVVSLLRDYWDEIIISHNNMYVAALDAKRVETIFNNIHEYTYSFVNQSKGFNKFLKEIQNEYSNYTSQEVENFTQPVRLSSALLNFYRGLPKWVQQSNLIGEDLQELKSDLRRLEIAPYETLLKMYEEYQKPEVLINKIENLASSMDFLLEKIVCELEKITGKNNIAEIGESLSKENKISQVIKSLNEINLPNFIEKYIGVPVSNWSDDTFALFIHTFKQEFNNLEYSTDNSILDMIGLYQEQELSAKGKTIYRNLENILSNAGKNLPEEEKAAILLKLIKKL